MKFLAIVALAFGGINSIVLSQGMDQLENAKKVTVILDSYSKHKQLEVFKNIDDPYLQFLTVFNELLTLEDILKESRGFSSRNIGFTGRNGIEYDSGLSPESIDDLVDREAYRKALDVNSENIKKIRILFEIRNNLVALLQGTVKNLDKKYQRMAASMVEKL